MKHFLLVTILSIVGLLANAQTVVLDSLSYATGYAMTHEALETGFLNKDDIPEVIRGLDDALDYLKYCNDSISQTVFGIGGMQAIFLYDGIQGKNVPYNCILKGVEKVINDEIHLPEDTVAILRYMDEIPKNVDPLTLPAEEQCKFFTGFGVMKALQPIAQEYICQITGKAADEVPIDHKAYAAGFAMMLKQMDLSDNAEGNGYKKGSECGFALVMEGFVHKLSKTDVLDGCRAAAGMAERKMSIEEIYRIVPQEFRHVNDEVDPYPEE